MAGPSLSHILDPPQPTTSGYPYSTPQIYQRYDQQRNHSTPASTIPNPSPQIRSVATTGADASSAPAPVSAPATISSTTNPSISQDQSATSPSSTSHSNHSGNNLYACRDCGRSYSRPEHLVRHVQTHTLGRRFACDICQKSFARKDLLRRHVANHDNDSPKKRRRTTTSPGAGRVSHACRSCAVARVKCDDQKPCKRCVSRKLNCESSEAPSTAAMHLMHLSANAHSSSTSKRNVGTAAHERDKPGTAHSSTTSTSSASPAPFPQTRPLPVLPAPGHNAALTERALASPALPSLNPDGTYTSDLTPPLFVNPTSNTSGPNRLSFPEFLRNILHEKMMDPSKMTDYQGLGILDFCDNVRFDLTEADFGLLDYWNSEGLNAPVDTLNRLDSSMDMSQMRYNLARIWANSPWTWDSKAREGSYRDSESVRMGRDRVERIISERLEQPARDRVLALVLSSGSQDSMMRRVASSFPSTEVMDSLVHNFLSCLAGQTSEWIHLPSFKLNEQCPEWIATAAAAGAVLSPIPTLHRFGFALQEAVRTPLSGWFQDTSTPIQDIGYVQALILAQDIGLWSGNRRRMEIAECQLAVPVTMMRYRSKFQRFSYPSSAVVISDEGALLEDKWKEWTEGERWKRLVFHCYLRDAQCSMTTLTNPSISYAELTLPLPESRELWHARSALEWKAEYLARHSGPSRRVPSIGDLLHDVHLLPATHQHVDMQLSISIFLHGYWALILEYRQLSTVHRARSYTGSISGSQGMLLNSRHQEMVKDLQSFQLMSAEWPDMTSQEHLMLHLLLLNLHASLDDLQLFAGKEGEEQARRICPILQQWTNSAEARSAVWCAGQILRYAKAMAPGQLKDFYAVAVHHACMTLWTYGLVMKADRRQQQPLPGQYGWELVYMDGTDSMAIQRFIGYAQGRPAIRGPSLRDSTAEAPLAEPRECVEVVQQVLRSNFKSHNPAEENPPIVENVCRLMKQLGDAAWTVGLG